MDASDFGACRNNFPKKKEACNRLDNMRGECHKLKEVLLKKIKERKEQSEVISYYLQHAHNKLFANENEYVLKSIFIEFF